MHTAAQYEYNLEVSKQGCGSVPGIHFFRIRIQHLRMNTNPDPDPIRIQGFKDQKFKKNYS
jgi:hypothetical protein